MGSSLLAVTFGAVDPGPVARFWATLLGREVLATSGGLLLPGDATRVGLRFAPAAGAVATQRTHLHLTSGTDAQQQETVATALGLGARHVDVGQRPEEGHVVLQDPGGNAFCVIEPGNRFLADCGFLGEVAGTGTRDLGLFWSEVLGWPLVWDRDEETAVQSPAGGTKVSWGGQPRPPQPVRSGQRLDLVTDEDGPAGVARRRAVEGHRRRARRRAAGPGRQRVPPGPSGRPSRAATLVLSTAGGPRRAS